MAFTAVTFHNLDFLWLIIWNYP